MTLIATRSVRTPGIFHRAFAVFWTFLEALESGSSSYVFDRIECLEREVGHLKEELRPSRDPRTSDDSAAGASWGLTPTAPPRSPT